MTETRPIALVGLRASGKTTLGRLLAARLGRAFVDLDEELAAEDAALRGTRDRRPAGVILAEDGVEPFRDLEARALERVLTRTQPLVLATGGGVVERARNRLLLRTRARCLWLSVPVEELERRIELDPTPRPALLGKDAARESADLLARRAPLYRELEAEMLPCGTATPDELLARALALLGPRSSSAR